MELLSKYERVVARILAEMGRQKLSYTSLAKRMGPGWSAELVALRLGLALPGQIGGRVPLSRSEVLTFTKALRIPPAYLADAPLLQAA
jgi:hypothetical protein